MASTAEKGAPSPAREIKTTDLNPVLSAGEDEEQIVPALQSLLRAGWTLDTAGTGVSKTFFFKTYFKGISFTNLVAAESATKKHHPTMTVKFGSVHVHWTTHRPAGLSMKDLELAAHCDRGAELVGAVAQGEGQKCS
ncbi:hypothetical protein ASPZODRAFT_65028 [Penicilliopsis zonata CBS 506.65]|uniref:4a-hydroxytetrahydrobiopterin dehydratase n=1 Tax=Penicilliopsis zonata CBS 506.65 TaxID=1073090 RepID=A0A1L9SJ65_9EURO|nr:hypothetical protein ASPZODRAFT_65028 [Penicilliopsis zonata CBS 506.65]OJJ47151.1 hypothetical protein ASPZODRAFT_65028 [Penicilliopsis zonata CBS 506.65]